ncbi:5'/3'-nucleotidase SurE [Salinisphaera hydrothermalis]|uniref:5'-nucleotidase SurE n=1 Tax=Salinisphaera hydrothermalis (strain C41B8) TaxID=1304275 RepID=A0A084ILR7_SALHC|nr:5'/3'-nucleotidase SurE [Salinisphaera hydrothermalis]KEZ77651.1 5'-nucleotidase surE 1 [Salinisphaera hydrothermalis C41B8]
MKRFQRILVTNDDGVEAPGLAVAERMAVALGEEVWVVAPQTDQSGVGQGISVHRPLQALRRGERRYAVSGTPADCVMYALASLCADRAPDLVLSGVNWGANLSDSVMYSGTVGAALAADHLGLDAIALSQAYHAGYEPDFSVATAFAQRVIEQLLARRARDGNCCWSVNFPMQPLDSIRGLRFTRQARGAIRTPTLTPVIESDPHSGQWLGFEGNARSLADPRCDVVALREHYVSATPLHGTRCNESLLERAADDLEIDIRS